MADPTEGQMDAQLQAAVALLDNYLDQQTVPADEDAYNASIISDFEAQQTQGARLMRSRGASASSSGATVLSPLLEAYAHHIVKSPERTSQAALDRIYAYFVANAKTIKSRDITYGTIPGFAAGKGLLRRLVVDENSYTLENEFVETKTLRCIRDQNTGATRYREAFEIKGLAAGIDSLAVEGSGSVRRNFLSRDSSGSLLRNSTFSQFVIAGAFAAGEYTLQPGDTISGWEILAGDSTAVLDQVDVAKTISGDPVPTAVRATAANQLTLSQLFSTNRLQLSADVPYVPQLFVKPALGLTTGNLTLTWGSQVEVIALSTLTLGEWNDVAAVFDAKLWPAVFNVEAARFTIDVAGHDVAVGVDEVRFQALEPFDGTWWDLSSAADDGDDFLLDDSQAITDVLAGLDSKIQKWLWRSYARYLPHSGTPSIADPA